MTPGVKRLLLRVLKWVIVPVALLLLGYLVIGPLVLPAIAHNFIPSSGGSADDPLPGEPTPEAKAK